MKSRPLIIAAVVVAVALAAFGFWRFGPGSGPAYPPAPPRVEVGTDAVVLAMRSGRAVAIVDLMGAAPELAPLAEKDIDRLVREMLGRMAQGWFSQERFRNAPDMTVQVVTVASHDEYQRPDPNSALRHGQLVVKNDAGKAGTFSGTLKFDNLRAMRDSFAKEQGPAQPAQDAGPIIREIPTVTPQELSEAIEQVLFDELDFWQHPRSVGNTYPSFEPLRVRTTSARYFLRNDLGGEKAAASGNRYGELVLDNASGSVTYLPQRVDFSGTRGYAIRLRKSDPASRISLSVQVDAQTVATVTEGTGAFAAIADTAWHDVRLPFSDFKFARVPLPTREKADWTAPVDFLAASRAPQGFVFGVAIALAGKAGDQLFFDRLSVLRAPGAARPGIVGGVLTPPESGYTVHVRNKSREWTAQPDDQGRFSIDVGEDAGIVEVFAEKDKEILAPDSGLYHEMSPAMPVLRISSTPEGGSYFPADTGMNTSKYEYTAPIGAHFRPGHFAVSRKQGDTMQFFLEQHSNGYGFLDRDRRMENPDKAFRVVVLGDSYYEGIYNDMRDVVWNQAEARAAMMGGRPVEVIAASHHHAPFINSWSQFTEYALKLKADLVVISLIHPEVLNFGIEDYVREWLGFHPDHPPSNIFSFAPDGSLAMKRFDPDWRAYTVEMSPEEHKAIRARIDTTQYVRTDIENAPEWVGQNLRLIEAALIRFREEAAKTGTEVALGYSPWEVNMERMEPRGDYKKDVSLLRPRMKALAERAGITFLDLSSRIYDGHTKEDIFYIPGDGHWSSFAHYRAGLALYEEIAKRSAAKPR